jgi:hypothetical protein
VSARAATGVSTLEPISKASHALDRTPRNFTRLAQKLRDTARTPM